MTLNHMEEIHSIFIFINYVSITMVSLERVEFDVF